MSIINNFSLKPYIDINIFSSIMSSLYLNGELKIAVAVSGGSDSLCLALLLNSWAKQHKAKITALIVNHKLRENINEEIKQVVIWLQKYNIHTVTLTIQNIDINRKLQQNARKERYKVLLEYCENNNIAYLAIGHHFNDLVETLVMREKRGSIIWGNSSISLVRNLGKVLLFRPLLYFNKKAVINTLQRMNQAWIEDPSNQNTKFERVLIRNELGSLTEKQTMLYSFIIQNNKDNRIKLEQECVEYLVKESKLNQFGEIMISLNSFLKLELQHQIAIIGIIVKFIANKEYMPRIMKIKFLIQQLKSSTNKLRKYTLGGSLIELQKLKRSFIFNDQISDYIYIKFRKVAKYISHKVKIIDLNTNSFIWDNRFLISNINKYPTNYFFAKLTINEYNSLCKVSEIKKIIKKFFLEYNSILTLPWLFNNNSKPIPEWVNNLLDENCVKFLPTNNLLNDMLYNFSIDKENHLY